MSVRQAPGGKPLPDELVVALPDELALLVEAPPVEVLPTMPPVPLDDDPPWPPVPATFEPQAISRESAASAEKPVGKLLPGVYASYTMRRYSSTDCIDVRLARIGSIYDLRGLVGMERIGGCRSMGDHSGGRRNRSRTGGWSEGKSSDLR